MDCVSPRGGVLGPEGRAWLLRAEAEYSRVAGASDVERWRHTTEEFGYGHRYEQARSRWRLAEASIAWDHAWRQAQWRRIGRMVAAVVLLLIALAQAVRAMYWRSSMLAICLSQVRSVTS